MGMWPLTRSPRTPSIVVVVGSLSLSLAAPARGQTAAGGGPPPPDRGDTTGEPSEVERGDAGGDHPSQVSWRNADLREVAEEDSGLDATDRTSLRRGERFFGMPIEVSVAGQVAIQKGTYGAGGGAIGGGTALTFLVRLPLGRGPVERAPVAMIPGAASPRYQVVSDSGVAARGSRRRRYRLPGPLVQRVVRAALAANGLGPDDSRLTHIATRARMSAALPELRLRVVRGADQSLRFVPTDADPYRAQATDGASMLYEARATWRLDRLVFADEEIAVERLRAERASERRKLLRAVIDAIGAYQRARGAPAASPEERAERDARLAAASATLDGLTDGAWSTLLAGAGTPEDEEESD